MFVVRVPVLSLQITVVHPNVSTEGKDLKIGRASWRERVSSYV